MCHRYMWEYLMIAEKKIGENVNREINPEYPIPAAAVSQKPPHGDISGTKRGIIDPLVSKRPEKNFWKKLQTKSKNFKDVQNPISVFKFWGWLGFWKSAATCCCSSPPTHGAATFTQFWLGCFTWDDDYDDFCGHTTTKDFFLLIPLPVPNWASPKA